MILTADYGDDLVGYTRDHRPLYRFDIVPGADLRGARIGNFDLTDRNFTNVDLRGAEFGVITNITWAQYSQAIVDETTVAPVLFAIEARATVAYVRSFIGKSNKPVPPVQYRSRALEVAPLTIERPQRTMPGDLPFGLGR